MAQIENGYSSPHNRHQRREEASSPQTKMQPASAHTTKKSTDGEKLISMFSAIRSLGLTSAQFTKTLGILKKSGMLNGKTTAALQEVFLGATKNGSIPAKSLKQIEALGKEFSVLGKAMTVLSGLFNTMLLFKDGKYPQAAAEVYKTAVSVAASGPIAAKMATINMINTALQAFHPDYKKSSLCKFVGAMDLVNLGGIAVDSIGTLFTAWSKDGADIKKLDALVGRMRSSGAGFLVDVGEKIGSDAFEIYDEVQTSGNSKAYYPDWDAIKTTIRRSYGR